MPAVALVALAAAAGHVRSLAAPFFADDWLFLDQVRFRSLLDVLASPDPIGNYFRPLGRQVWFSVLAAVSAENPWLFHAANLACLMVAVVLLAQLARRLAGPTAGVIAAAFLALHYAADVPVLWASGAQELLSLALVLAALELHVRGARRSAAVVFLGALLAKEAVVLAPVVACALDTDGGPWRDRLRRAWAWGAAVLAWLAIATAVAALRGTPGAGLQLSLEGPLAAPLLLARVTFGLEWLAGQRPWAEWTDPGLGGWLAILLAVVAVLVVAPRRTPLRSRSARRGVGTSALPRSTAHDTRAAIRAGLLWALAGALPVAAVAPQWSAYYFLFALAGVGLALGAWLSSRPVSLAIAVVLVSGLASSQARGLQEFATAPSAWSGQSHVNRFYLERGMAVISRGIADLRRQMPAPLPRTTVFVAGLPSFAAFQVADGPLVRGVYRDTTLRSYYLSQLTAERLARGPWRVFFYNGGTGRLDDQTGQPGVLSSTALGMILSEQLDVAEAALSAADGQGELDLGRTYVSAWVAMERGDRALALQRLSAAHYRAEGGGGAAVAEVRQKLAVRDTLGALDVLREAMQRHALDPELHALAADLLLSRPESMAEGQVEAFAARVLAPERGGSWRRWAQVLVRENRPELAIAALDRYAKLDPARWAPDRDAQRLRAVLVQMKPGGDLAQRGLKQVMAP